MGTVRDRGSAAPSGLGPVVGLVGLVATSVSIAQAEPDHPIDLSWSAPAGCPEASFVRGRIDDLLAGASAGQPLSARVDVTAGPTGFRVEMLLTSEAGDGERQLEAASCEEIAEATALVVALAYDPDAVVANQARAAEGGAEGSTDGSGGAAGGGEPLPSEPRILPLPPVVPTAPGSEPPAPPAVDEAPRRFVVDADRLRRWRLWAAPLVGAEAGALPRMGAFAGGAMGFRYHPFELAVRGGYLLTVRETVPTRDAGGDFDRWSVGPVICGAPWRSRRAAEGEPGGLRLSGCLALELGQMRGRGFGVENPDEGSALWVSPSVEGGASLSLASWLELQLGLGLGFPLLRPDFVLNQVGIVHRASSVTGRGTLGLVLLY